MAFTIAKGIPMFLLDGRVLVDNTNTDETNRLFLIDFEGELLGGAAGYVRIQFIVMTNQIVVNCKNSDGAWTKVATYTSV